MVRKGKKVTPKDTIDKIIKRAVQKIRKVFPRMSPSLCSMYMEHMIPLLGIQNDEYNLDSIEQRLNSFIDSRLYKFDTILSEYTHEIQSQLANCPCDRYKTKLSS